MPKALILRPKQYWSGRFWDLDRIIDFLCVHYGLKKHTYPRTWKYRLLINAHREQNSTNYSRKGYGPDWKYEIKKNILEYDPPGRLPIEALKLATKHLKEIEIGQWVKDKINTSC